jgi:RimJ/RimL family protein N-acetyltransferase
MMQLSPENREVLRPLFADYPYLQGLAYGVLSGALGEAFADQPQHATVGMSCVPDFALFAGDASCATAAALIRSRPVGTWLVGQDVAWQERFVEIWGDHLKQKERFAFRSPAAWDRDRLAILIQELPTGCTLKPVTEADAARFAQLSKHLVDFDAQGRPTIAHSIGFGVAHEEQFIAGCAGAPAGGMLEFEIQTALAHRRRGLATVVAAAMIAYCLDHDLKPCWDAANAMSARLAEKIGFVERTPYLAYQIVERDPCA